jgi:hypothetical protein
VRRSLVIITDGEGAAGSGVVATQAEGLGAGEFGASCDGSGVWDAMGGTVPGAAEGPQAAPSA